MIETTATYNSFWLIIFASIVIISVGCIIAVVIIKLKNKDTDIFFKSNDNAKDVTLNVTDKVVTLAWDSTKEQELHRIECLIKEISFKVDALTERVIYLEKHKD